MYHVSEDPRAVRSAKLICEGLEKCLEEKPFDKIRINDIYEKCSVSRATFYRLFDSKDDVLFYECDKLLSERLQIVGSMAFASKTEMAVYTAKIWLSHLTLIKAIIDNGLYYILYETQRKNAGLLTKIYDIQPLDEKQKDYFIAALSSLICGALRVYFMHGATEPIEDIYKTICQCLDIIAVSFDPQAK